MTAARRDLIARLCRPLLDVAGPGAVVVDVGADHGHVAAALGAIATERHPRRIGRRDVPWVVADGLAPFRRVDVAVVAGMGAHTIAGILQRGPRPTIGAVLHAPDDPPVLRLWLAEHGWRIVAEGLAPEARRFAEVVVVRPGHEAATGLHLELGPRLLEGDDPLLADHLRQLHRWCAGLAAHTHGRDPVKHAHFRRRADFLADQLATRGWAAP